MTSLYVGRQEFQVSEWDTPWIKAAKEHVIQTAEEVGDPRFYEAVSLFNRVLALSEIPDECLSYAKRFHNLFSLCIVGLNRGVDSLAFVRECVRRSFAVSQVVPFQVSGETLQQVRDDEIEEIAKSLVDFGFIIPAHQE